MNLLSEKQYEFLIQKLKGKIDQETFVKEFNQEITLKYCLDLIAYSKLEKDVFFLNRIIQGICSHLPYEDKLSIYRSLLLDNNHEMHETIVEALQVIYKSEPGNSEFIKKVFLNPPNHLVTEDQIESFKFNCLYAIKSQIQEESDIVLNELKSSNDPVVLEFLDELEF